MATATVAALPPLPAGFTLDQPEQEPVPALPPGFTIDDPNAPAQLPVNTAERAALQAQLDQRLASADEAGKTLRGRELTAEIARPFLRGATDLADGVLGLPKLAAALPVGALNLAGANIRSPLGFSLKELGSDAGKSLAPRNGTERLSSAITQGVGGVLGGVGLGSLAAGAGGTAGAVGTQFAAQPGIQTASAVTSGLASEGTRKLGGGPIAQTVGGILGGIVPGAALATAQKIGTGLSRTPEAQRLLDRGVELTPGQMNPKGMYNQLEENVQSLPVIGPIVRNSRDAARTGVQRAAIQEGSAPGAVIQQSDDVAQMLDEAYQSFQPLYDQAKGFPVRPAIVNTTGPDLPIDQAISRAVANRGVRATADDRAAVQGFLDDQLTKPFSTSDDLLNIRSAVRQEARDATRGNQIAQAKLLDDADDALSKALESQLPPDALKALKAADSKYGDYKIAERAVARGTDRPGGFTPNDLSQAVAQGNRGGNAGSYARGGGGPLREIAADARKTLDSRSPPTGQRILGLVPAAALSPAALAASGTQTGRRLAAGQYGFQQSLDNAIQQAGLEGGVGARQSATQELIQSLTDQDRLALAIQQASERRKRGER